MNKTFTSVFKACINNGQLHKGVSKGPCRIMNMIAHNNVRTTYKGIELYDMIHKETSKTDRILTVGGDHSVAFYSIAAQMNKFESNNLGIVWFDTHTDINTRATSTTGNTHGMPVSFLMGMGDIRNRMKFPFLDPKNIVYVGPRDIDLPEQRILNDLNVTVIRSDELLQSKHIPKIMCDVLDKHLGHCDKLHLSFDVDVMDPDVFPCTGTPVENGLNLQQTKQVLDAVYQDDRFVSMDIVEYNPEIRPEYAIECDKVIKYLTL